MVFGLLFAKVTSVNTFEGLVVQTKMTNSVTRAYMRVCKPFRKIVGLLVGLACVPMVYQ